MNPFLYPTVAQPLSARPVIQRPAGRRRASRALCAAGLAALAWSACAAAVDLNTASQAELQTVRGIGPRTAQIILQERNRGGPFESFSDLSDRVRGIGPRRAQALQSAGLTLGSAARSGPLGRPAAPPAPRSGATRLGASMR